MLRGGCLAALLLLVPGAALAQNLDFGAPAEQTAQQSEAGSSARLPVGPWRANGPPAPEIAGNVQQTSWRITTDATTRMLADRLRTQLEADGWRVLFACETAACGGFDFRFAMPLLAEPDMHVDLGDFRYVMAGKGAARLALMISRAQQAAFVQMTRITPGEAPDVAAVVQPAATAGPGGGLPASGSMVLEDLVFATGARDLAPGDYASLRGLAGWLAAHPQAQVALVGHTDATGGLDGNIAISEARAASVRRALIALGVAGDRVVAKGVGYLAPRASNQTPEGQAQNRRVEVMLTTTP